MGKPPVARLLAAAVIVGASALLTGAGVAFAAFSSPTAAAGSIFGAATLAAPSNLSLSSACTAVSPVVFRASSSAIGTLGSLTVAKPVGVVAGDVMLAQFGARAFASTITAPSGWTLVRDDSLDVGGGGVQSAIYVKIADAGEPASYTWVSSQSARTGGGIAAYSGASGVTPVDVTAAQTGTSTTPTAPGVTTTVDETYLATFFVARQEPIVTLPGGMNDRWNLDSAGGAGSVGVGASDEARPVAGPTGSRSATIATTFDWIGQSVAVRAGSTPAISASWTATTSTFASGYKVQRWLGGVQQNELTVTPRTTTSVTDLPLAAATTYSYRVFSYHLGWTSAAVTQTHTTPSC